ncbi:hypothetical protein T11_11459 [Trichinella zimbabwensis]|uniref:Uncharacterized protein n=1 Tax=Trichinella zimbabwensis TaxID=268475 RepID=A0A0V1F8D5_9BILA|nr:hypothetical protein T11_11459 [Trichinella zimbabwensis]
MTDKGTAKYPYGRISLSEWCFLLCKTEEYCFPTEIL